MPHASASLHRLFPPYLLYALMVSTGGLLFGLDTGTIGPVTTMAQFAADHGAYDSFVHGLVVSSILIPAALTSFVAGPLADRAGREYGIMCGAAIFTIGAIIEASSLSLPMFIGGRVVAGAGEGLFLSTVVVYICETVPSHRRGALASLCQMATTVGIAAGFFICYGTANLVGSLAWRTPYILQSSVAGMFAFGCLILPPSPRLLLSSGCVGEVPAALTRLGLDAQDFAAETQTLVTSHDAEEKRHPLAGVYALKKPRSRDPALLAVFLMAMCQFAGIDGVLYYAPVLFAQAGLEESTAAFLASGGTALVIFVVTIPACLLADKVSRRGSTLVGGIGMAALMFLVGSLYAAGVVKSTNAGSTPARWVVVVAIYIYAALYAGTWAVMVRIHASEIQPSETRAVASALAQSANWIANYAIALSTPVLLSKSSYGAYFLFGGCAAVTVLVCLVHMPETKGRPLDSVIEADEARVLRFGGSVER